VGTADPDSMASLKSIVMVIHNELPSNCHGSPEKVKIWENLIRLKNS
jgi:hypothetical protein